MSMGKAAQVVFRPSSESPGFYRFHYGQLASHGTFVEDPSGSLPAFLEAVGVPFFSISGSDLVEMFVGVGASRVRDLFEEEIGRAHV